MKFLFTLSISNIYIILSTVCEKYAEAKINYTNKYKNMQSIVYEPPIESGFFVWEYLQKNEDVLFFSYHRWNTFFYLKSRS